ncbi:MAG: hypothetical protein RL318_267 [Fibrobacterota bacterium]|jgi:hypothetical protein
MFRIPSSLVLLALTLLAPLPGTAAPVWIDSLGTGCTGVATPLDNFNGEFAGLPYKNLQGGYWVAFTDTTSGIPGRANGVSTLLQDSNTIQGFQYTLGDEANKWYASITATLDKGDSVAHPEAGWARLGTSFKDKMTGDNTNCLDASTVKGFSFGLSMPEGFDEGNLVGTIVRVGSADAPDSVAYSVGIPRARFNNGTICLDPGQFGQSVLLNNVSSFAWELKIQTSAKTAKPSSIQISEVKLWADVPLDTVTNACTKYSTGPHCGTHLTRGFKPDIIHPCSGSGLGVVKTGGVQGASLQVANKGRTVVLNYALGGAAPVAIEIQRLDGRKVAFFAGAASASNLTLPMNLSRGTYLAVVRSGTSKLVVPFAVTQ